MIPSSIEVTNIPQLKDNYSYVISSKENDSAIIVDPAESSSILKFIKNKKLSIKAIILTHHHFDHTAGVLDIINDKDIPVYSPNKKIKGTSILVRDKDKINFDTIAFETIATPGHTLDHVVYYSKKEKILFSGDTLFRLGCGRVFEGTYEQMFNSLKSLESLENDIYVYCGHEYTLNNINFLESVFFNNKELEFIKKKIIKQLKLSNASIPFNLGEEKSFNPFLSTKSTYYQEYKKKKNLTDFEMFSHIRDLKNNY